MTSPTRKFRSCAYQPRSGGRVKPGAHQPQEFSEKYAQSPGGATSVSTGSFAVAPPGLDRVGSAFLGADAPSSIRSSLRDCRNAQLLNAQARGSFRQQTPTPCLRLGLVRKFTRIKLERHHFGDMASAGGHHKCCAARMATPFQWDRPHDFCDTTDSPLSCQRPDAGGGR